jgi:DNA-binding NarL/FixJ family response regulator
METNKISPLINVLIVGDHKLLRDGLTKMLHTFKKELPVTIMEAENGDIALRMLSNFPFDLCIMDYQLPTITGPETLLRMLRFRPELKVLALSNYNEIKCISEMLEVGALGYVLKSVHATQLLSAINTVLAGKKYFCNEVALTLIASVKETDSKNNPQYNISPRELEILILIAQEMTNEEISKKLFLARRTVDTHRQNLLAKLKVRNSAGLVRIAMELNLLK